MPTTRLQGIFYYALRRRLSPRRRFEWFPPFASMGVRVTEMSQDGRRLSLRLPLNFYNRNPGGSMFGGAMASLADPVPALMCARIFENCAVWTRSMHIDFRHEGRSDLVMRVEISAEQVNAIGVELARRGRATPEFEYGFFDARERLCAWVHNRVALRPPHHRPEGGALGHKRH
ncbi:MAG: DUF4442 domain-containing protein [Pseudomonadota bacterium]